MEMKPCKIMAGQWSELPSDILNLVGDKLISHIGDYIRFRAVCKAWLAATPDLRGRGHVPPQVPWLYDRYTRSSTASSKAWPSLSEAGSSSAAYHRRYVGGHERREPIICSSNGWLFIARSSTEIYMLNPLINVQTRLPSVPLYEHDIKVVFTEFGSKVTRSLADCSTRLMNIAMTEAPTASGDGVSTGCVMLALLTGPRTLLSLRGGDDAWAVVEKNCHYTDITYCDARFFAVDCWRRITIYNNNVEKVAARLGSLVQPTFFSPWRLVESSGKLFVLRKIHQLVPSVSEEEQHPPLYLFERVEIFGFDQGREPLFVEVKSLQEHVLFLGQGCSVLVPTEFHDGWRGNTIHCLVERFLRGDKVVCESSGGVYKFGEKEPVLLNDMNDNGFWYIPELR